MKMRPILFSTAMVQAILDGRKTQTRRVLKKPYYCPYGQPGDILWVRETWVNLNSDCAIIKPLYIYKCDGISERFTGKIKWKPSIHMPFAAARIFLRIKSVRVQMLQDISEQDAIAEGIIHKSMNDPKVEFQHLWQAINGPESWNANPWVWVVEFERISREEAGL